MLKKLLGIGAHVSGTMRDEKAIQLIRLYSLFPIPEFPLKEKEVINEIEHYLGTYERSYPGYVLLQFFDCKISDAYLACCRANDILPVTPQIRYKFKNIPAGIFSEEFWKKSKFYDIKPSDKLSDIPMSKKETTAVKVYTDNLEIMVKELIDVIKLAKVTGNNWPDTDKILVPITGEIDEPDWTVRFIRMLKGSITEAEGLNILKYGSILNPLMMSALGTLEQREAVAVDMYLKDQMSMADIAMQFGVSSSRINQIIAKAFRKLRHPKRSSEILYVVRMTDADADALECIEKYYKDTKKETKIAKIIDVLTSNPVKLISENKFIQAMFFVPINECFDKLKDYGISYDDNPAPVSLPEPIKFNKPGLDISIEDMDLSIRSFNCLKRVGLYTIKDVISYSHEYGFIKIRNLGRKSADEVIDKLECLGFGDLLPRDPMLSDDEQEEV